MLLKRLMGHFVLEKTNFGKVVYTQGDKADKVYVIFSGDFEIIRKKQNKMTNKEMEYK